MTALEMEMPSLTAERGFAAMRHFLDAYRERDGGQSDDLAMLLSSLAPKSDGKPVDIALWNDWLEAIERTR
ncbi:hypothetical protein [Sphingomonas sp. UNC305MFCol5.2]|uniref:hypothetical protein n=1 Tax=Sphingomonas sp. UNC305MFCol5.2 TaxID=1449076 RepID=UPI000418FCC1|nr:hypothetical protein [Sphingomonas sp. UNC305MFCol5.2]